MRAAPGIRLGLVALGTEGAAPVLARAIKADLDAVYQTHMSNYECWADCYESVGRAYTEETEIDTILADWGYAQRHERRYSGPRSSSSLPPNSAFGDHEQVA